jgi:hypothetical protein
MGVNVSVAETGGAALAALRARGYGEEAIRQHLRWKAARARLEAGPKPAPAPPAPPSSAVVLPPPSPPAAAPNATEIAAADFLAAHAVADALLGRAPKSPPPTTLIQQVVAEDFGVTVGDILSARREHAVVEPRMVAAYLAKTMRPDSLPAIGRRFGGRDHTTIIHALRTIGARRAAEPEFAARVEDLALRVRARAAARGEGAWGA